MSSSNLKMRKICEWCGTEFEAQKSTTHYCSHLCNSRAYKAKKRTQIKAIVEKQTDEAIKNLPIAGFKDNEFLKCAQAAVILGVSRKTVYNLIESGKLKAARLSSRMTLIRRKDIDALLEIEIPYEPKQKKEKTPITEFYTLDEITEKFGVKVRRIWDIIKTKNIPTTKLGNKTYISQKHIDNYFKNKNKKPLPEIPDSKEFYTIPEAMDIYQLTRDALYYYCSYYSVTRVKKGRNVEINKKELDKLFEKPIIV